MDHAITIRDVILAAAGLGVVLIVLGGAMWLLDVLANAFKD